MIETYDDLDMNGIEPRFYAEVPIDVQARIVGAEPLQRLVFNRRVQKYQVLYKEPTIRQPLDGGWLVGWQIIATFDAPLDVDQIISTMKKREDFVAFKLKQMGYESLEAYLDDAENILKKQTEDNLSDAVDEHWSVWTPGVTRVGPLGEYGNSDRFFEKSVSGVLDKTRRHSRTGKVLFVPPSVGLRGGEG